MFKDKLDMFQISAWKFIPRLLMILALVGLSSCKKTSPDSLEKLVSGNNKGEDQASSSEEVKLSIVGGNNQIGAPSTVFPDPLKVQLLKNGQPLSGATIHYGVVSGVGGSFSASSVDTDNSGMASASFIAGSGPGVSVISAKYNDHQVEFNENVVSQNGIISKISGDGQSGEVGTMVGSPLVVQVVDAGSGQGLAGILISFSVIDGNGRINSTSNLYTATTDGNGIASVPFQLGTLAGLNRVEASIASLPSQVVDFSLTGSVSLSAPISLLKTEVVLGSSNAPADGSTTTVATVQLKDQYGNNLAKAGENVAFNLNTGTLVGSVQDLGGGTYRQTVRVPSSSAINPMEVSATVNSQALTSEPAQIQLIAGNVDLAVSTIESSAAQLVADGGSNTVITVSLKDSLGNSLGTGGENVVISTTLGQMVGSVSDNGDGTYSQTIKSSYLAGDAIISATVGGSPLGSNLDFSFVAGPADLSESVITVSPSVIPPDGTSTSLVTVALRDQYGNQMQTSGGTVTLDATSGTWSGAVVDNGDGTYQRSLVSAVSPGSATIDGTLNSSALAKTAKVYFTSGSSGPSVNHSSIEILGGVNKFPADGAQTFSVRVTLRDSSNQQLDQGGSDVGITASSGSLVGSVVDNGNGTYDQVIRAPASSSIANIEASVDGQSLASGVNAYFYGALSLSQSSIKSFPDAIESNGTSQSLIVLQAKDSNGISIPVGGESGLLFSSTAGTLQDSLTDNGNGTYTQYVQSSTSSETAIISATKDSVGLSDTASVEFFLASNLAGTTIDCSNIASYKNTNIMVDNGTLVMNSIENATDCSSDFVFKSVTLRNSAILTHKKTTATIEYGLSFSAGSVNIDGASSIDVSGKGYQADGTTDVFRVQGNQLVKNRAGVDVYGAVGGTHAGQGGVYRSYDNASYSYGNMFRPFSLGASGATGSAGQYPGHGGGRVKIKILNGGTLTVNGSIRADGVGGHGYVEAGAGAGGSVWVETGAVKGNGYISANGGYDGYGAGGGGRVALYYSSATDAFAYPASIVDSVRAFGGSGNSADAYGAAGTVYLKGETQALGDLSLNNGGKVAAFAKTYISAPAATTPDGITTTTITKTGHFQDVYAQTPSPYIGYYISPDVNQNVTPERADDVAFIIAGSDGNSVSVNGENFLDYSDGSQTFELFLKFDNFQVAGGANYEGGANILSMGGDISSGNKTVAYSGRFNGDLIEFASMLQDFTIDGGGNSVKAIYGDINVSGSISFKNGLFETGKLTSQNLVLDGAEVIAGAAKGNLAIDLSGNLSLINLSVLEQAPTDILVERSLEIKAAGLILESGSLISAIGKGFLPSSSSYEFRSLGNVISSALGTVSRAGGSHGGRGGVYSSAEQTNPTYGSIANPYTSGSSGSGNPNDSNYYNYPGGGIIRLDISGGDAVINGNINASGVGSTYQHRTGGAGGSVWLKSGSVRGSGLISANGGDGGSSTGTGGGGGRIAIYYGSSSEGFAYPGSIVNRAQAFGGAGRGSDSSRFGDGGAGTIYFKGAAQTYGDLLIKNNSPDGAEFSPTFLNLPGGVSQTVSSTTLSSAGAYGEGEGGAYNSNHLEGFSLVPNVEENGTEEYGDNTLFKIASQSFDDLYTESGDLTSVSASGDKYQVVALFDNIQIEGGAQLEATGPIISLSGDLSSLDSSSLIINGGIKTAQFETGANTTFIGGESVIDKVFSQGLSLNGAKLVSGALKENISLNLSGPLVLENSSILEQKETTSLEEFALEVNATGLHVDASSVISASAKGYVNPSQSGVSSWLGNQIVGSMTTGGEAGGSHGGRGGVMDRWGNTVPTYGSVKYPYTSGSSGLSQVWSSSNYVAMHGGGIIKIITNGGSAFIDGTIEADGGSSTYSSRTGGAAGSIWLEVGAVAGNGYVKANGGNGGPSGAGGGGGRVAVHYQSASGGFAYPSGFFNRLSAFGGDGGSGTDFGDGGAGTVFIKSGSQTYGDLILNNNNLPAAGNSPTYLNMPVVSPSSGLTSLTLADGSAFGEGSLLVNTGHLLGMHLSPNTAENGTETFNDDTLFEITSQSVDELGVSSGDLTTIGSTGDNYQVILALDNLEISGGAKLESAGPILVKSGDLLSLDATTVSIAGSDVSGNTEYVNAQNYTLNSGEVIYSNLSLSGNLNIGAQGALSAKNMAISGNLSVDGGVVSAGTSGYAVNMSVDGGISLINGGMISQTPTTHTEISRLFINAGSLTIDSTSSVDVSGMGYTNEVYEQTRSVGNMNYKTYNNDTDGYAGGSHGGRGGRIGSYDSVYEVHGNFKEPLELGGSPGHIYGGSGGGAIRISLATSLTVDGAIRANGESSSYGAGAGGSIWIDAPDISGLGIIEANGGEGGTYGSGGGGRISVSYGNLLGDFAITPIYEKVKAFGGANPTDMRVGAAGTVFMKSTGQSYGDLIINNNGSPYVDRNFTRLLKADNSVSGGLSSNSLTTSITNPYGEDDQFKGFWLNPNTGQNGTTSLADDTIFEISSNTLSSITTSSGDMTLMANAGDPFKLTLALDNLEIRGNAYVNFGDQDVMVLKGDISSGDDLTFNLNGKFTAGTVDVGAADWFVGASGDASTIGVVCANNVACP